MRFPLCLLLSGLCVAASAGAAETQSDVRKLSFGDLRKSAAKFGTTLTLIKWENTPEEVDKTTDAAIRAANKALDAIGALDPKKVTFRNTIRAMDDLRFDLGQVENRVDVLKQAHPDAKVREAAVNGVEKFDEWKVGLDYRKDVYRTIKAFAATAPKLQGEDQRLFDEILRDYRRAGLDLSEEQQKEIEGSRKELSKTQAQFQVNINNASAPVQFTKAELEGVPQSVIDSYKKAGEQYEVNANVTFQVEGVMDNAANEATRKKLYLVRDNRARDKNLDLLKKAVQLRTTIAQKLGYKTWADYRTEPRMAKTGTTALDFVEKLKTGLQPKFDAEKATLKEIKTASKGTETPDINIWDWRYCAEQLRQQKYNIDAEALRVYFPFEKVLQGMFNVYQKIFGIQIREIDAPSKYVADLKLYAVIDAHSGAPLGLLYMDMFPRSGKFNHFANYSLIDGKRLEDGRYQRPTTSLLCNFPTPSKDHPSLLTHEHVTTIFHEFGHAMHAILTQAKYVRFSGTNVPQDFVEAPSQMLEYFSWDKKILDGFAADYRDPSKKIPEEVLSKLKAADLATKACYYRRQLGFAIVDLKLHSGLTDDQLNHLNEFCNGVIGEVFFPPDASTAGVAGFGHIMGDYDAGYYGYAWADAIAADMASVFQQAPGGFLDEKVGRKLRDEIYAQGSSRDITISIEKFLGRKQSIDPFLKHVGIR
jgi:thimet oligopeptidase